MSDLDREARAGLDDYMARRAIFFVPGEPRDQPEDVSSGTPLATSGGHVAILTARHCAEDAQRKQIRIGCHGRSQVLQDAVAAVMFHDDPEIDVALMLMKEPARVALREVALGPDDLATDDTSTEKDGWWLAGFPSKLVISRGVRDWAFMSVTYGTALAHPERDSSGRFRVLWTDRETPNGNVPMPHPGGISGGALWRFRPSDQIWSPRTRMRIAGVPVCWREAERVEIVEAVSRWRTWVVEALDRIDHAMPTEEFGSADGRDRGDASATIGTDGGDPIRREARGGAVLPLPDAVGDLKY